MRNSMNGWHEWPNPATWCNGRSERPESWFPSKPYRRSSSYILWAWLVWILLEARVTHSLAGPDHSTTNRCTLCTEMSTIGWSTKSRAYCLPSCGRCHRPQVTASEGRIEGGHTDRIVGSHNKCREAAERYEHMACQTMIEERDTTEYTAGCISRPGRGCIQVLVFVP